MNNRNAVSLQENTITAAISYTMLLLYLFATQ